ncbi:MAG: hypothetical protein JNK66_09760 [Chitinophagales bacterium]|nr:hypothetical protein [Chitinophagales bacterium]
MKKYCNICGNQLELSQRFCGGCAQVNPYFVQSFSLLSDQSENLEKLREEKERIERELQEREQAQLEFLRLEKMRKDAEEQERQRIEAITRQQLKREQHERENAEAKLQQQILSVKQETELHKKYTMDMVKEVRVELQQLEEDNRRLKNELEELAKQKAVAKSNDETPVVTQAVYAASPPPVTAAQVLSTSPQAEATAPKEQVNTHNKTKSKLVLAVLLLVPLVLVLIALATPLFKSIDVSHISEGNSITTPQTEDVASLVNTPPATEDYPLEDTLSTVNPQPTNEVASPSYVAPFRLTGAIAANDLIGKKITGCDITIHTLEEVRSVSPPVLIAQISSNMVKYKCTIRVVQAEASFIASPYLYYTPAGKFLKIDGTNCE